jgi:flagellar hook protein FlgE
MMGGGNYNANGAGVAPGTGTHIRYGGNYNETAPGSGIFTSTGVTPGQGTHINSGGNFIPDGSGGYTPVAAGKGTFIRGGGDFISDGAGGFTSVTPGTGTHNETASGSGIFEPNYIRSYIPNLIPNFIVDPTSATNSGRVLAAVREDTVFSRPNPAFGSTASAPEFLANIFNANGRTLGLEEGDPISISGSIGKNAITNVSPLVYRPNLQFIELMNFMQSGLRLPDMVPAADGRDARSMQINTIDPSTGLPTDPRAPIGSIIIRGQVGKAFEISGLSIHATNSNFTGDTPSLFNANMSPTEFQTARDTGIHATSIEVYDEAGAAHTVTMTFQHSGIPGKWLWDLQTQEGQRIISGNRGYVDFSEDGSPANWVFDDGTTEFRFDPMNGSAALSINLDIGRNGVFTGITQFRSASTTQAKAQDGYPMGKLSEIGISENGEINGLYTNGVNRLIARILLAEFQNPAGLLRAGDSMWAESNNSGQGVLQTPGEGTASTIKPGALEMSNVDLASEFTDLITTQRGYQANARIISTTDQILQELVQLVR